METQQSATLGKVYIATSLHNAKRANEIREKLESLGIVCTYDWTVHGQVFTEEELTKFGIAEENGVANADVFLMVFPGRCGSHFEMGLARGLGIPIVLLEEVETEQKTFYYLPGVHKTRTEDEAIRIILRILQDKGWPSAVPKTAGEVLQLIPQIFKALRGDDVDIQQARTGCDADQ